MRRRRRYEVVVEGLSGHAASQRSVIGEHRSEAEARESAAHERARLEVIHGEGASAWRIVVIRDGEVVAEERPAGRPDVGEPAPEPPPAEDAETASPSPPPAEDAETAPPSPPPVTEREEWPDMDISGPVPEWVISKVEDSIARRRGRDRGDEASEPAGDDPGDAPPRR